MPEIRRIQQTEAEAVTDLRDEAGRTVPAATERALVEAAVAWLYQHEVFVIRAEVDLDLPEDAEVLELLGFERETTRFGLYRSGS